MCVVLCQVSVGTKGDVMCAVRRGKQENGVEVCYNPRGLRVDFDGRVPFQTIKPAPGRDNLLKKQDKKPFPQPNVK